jgi:hypothetical protein
VVAFTFRARAEDTPRGWPQPDRAEIASTTSSCSARL